LPIDGNELEAKSTAPESVPSVAIGVQKIRPLRLPSRREGDDSQKVDKQSTTRSETLNNNAQKRKESSKKKTSAKKQEPARSKSPVKRPTSGRPRRPFICRRLVVNCKKNPSHTCCKFEAEQAKRDQEDLINNTTTEEAILEAADTAVETTPAIRTDEDSTSTTEKIIESSKTVPVLNVEKKGINNVQIVRNDVEKQRVEASVIPSPKREIKFKNIQLNSRERTRNIVNTRKTTGQPVKPVATIEEVPSDFVDIKISTNKRKVSEENNQPKEKTIKKTQEVEAPSPTQTLHHVTTSTLANIAPLVELTIAEEEPYERIPAECFTMSFDCKTSPTHMCCAYHQ